MKMKRPTIPLAILLGAALFFGTNEASAIFKKKNDATTQPIDIIKEFPPEQDEAEVSPPSKTTAKKPRTWRKKPDYSEFLIPTGGFLTTGEEYVQHITGGVEKSVSLSLGLADCLELALSNNPRIRAARHNALAERTKRLQTISNYSPRVNFSTNFSRVKPDSGTSNVSIDPFNEYLMGRIGVRQLIYDFGFTQNMFSINKLEHELAERNIVSVVDDVIFRVKDAYYYLLLALEQEHVMRDAVEYYEQIYKQANAFWEIGTRAKIDVLTAEVNLKAARVDLTGARCNIDLAIARLNNVMGMPFIEPYRVSEKLGFEGIWLTIRDAVEIANENRPDLQMAILGVKAADEYVKLSRKTFVPELGFEGNWQRSETRTQGESGRNSYNAGIYLSIPTINPLLVKGQIDQAKQLYAKQQYDARSAVNDIYLEIQLAYDKLLYTQSNIPVAAATVEKAHEALMMATGRYRVGEGDVMELKDAQLQYQKTRLAYLSALYEFNSAKANIEKAIGQTIAEFKL
jgi:outer membrane protein TolC